MPDAPDLYQYLGSTDKKPITDLGEGVVRLFSPSVYDRGGTVVFLDDFRYGLMAYEITRTGAGAAIKLVATKAQKGGKAAQFLCGTSATGKASLGVYLAPQQLNVMGLEVGFGVINNFDYLTIQLLRHDGSNTRKGEVRIDRVNAQLQYLKSDGSYVQFGDMPGLISTKNIFHNMKLYVDVANDQYVGFKLNNNAYSLSGIGTKIDANVDIPYVKSFIELDGTTAVATQGMLDFIIVTTDEQSTIVST